MPTRTENSSSALGNGQRWRLNTSGQLVDVEAANSGWDLAEEIVRLKIGEVTGDNDDMRSSIRTPPKSKISSTGVQVSETSPLDSSSNTSVGSSPHAPELPINISHSRGSSADTTTSSSHESVTGNALITRAVPLKNVVTHEAKERPHSFSGGLSSADLRRLQHSDDGFDGAERQLQQQQQQQWAQNQYRENALNNSEQLSYPSLMNNIHRPLPQAPQQQQLYDYRSGAQQSHQSSLVDQEEEYNHQRNFHLSQGLAAPAPTFPAARPNNGLNYRQLPRGFPQQVLPNPNGYPGTHTSHLSLGNTQQLYDMMLPSHHDHPAVTRVQQQHNVFRGTHHHSASDPSAIRDPATLALLSNSLQAFVPFQQALPHPSMPMYPNQFYGAQDVAVAQAMAARLQSQYTPQYGVPQQNDNMLASPTSTNDTSGPAAGNRKLGLYKTELCRSWEEKGTCRYGAKCQFAHGEDELRKVSRHPKYKTEICRTFWVSGSCPYGKRCCFIHTELPNSGAAPPSGTPITDSNSSQTRPDGRTRSLSTNSDPNPNDTNVSLLARISANNNSVATPVDKNPNNAAQLTRPGSLRVDTHFDGPSVKQNKSAYPTFASNGILLHAPEPITAKSPGPVTAGPDLGRQLNSRIEIVGFNNANKKTNSSSSNIRHSFNGTEVDLHFSPSTPTGHTAYTMVAGDNTHTSRVGGHVRAGSAGNWGSFSRNSHLATYPHASSPDNAVASPWSTTELAMGSSRLNEKAWA